MNDIKSARILWIIGALSVLWAAGASAQQPGTPAYNNSVLPAHGLGDTKMGGGDKRWGAFSSGTGGRYGWSLAQVSEKAARNDAVKECASTGAKDCRVEFVFFNSCAAVSAGSSRYAWSAGHPRRESMEALREQALERCGDQDCAIIKEGCSLPSG